MSETRVLPDSLDALDWDITCNVGNREASLAPSCSNPAVWVVVLRCCGLMGELCEGHFVERIASGSRLWQCHDCGACNIPAHEAFSRIERIR